MSCETLSSSIKNAVKRCRTLSRDNDFSTTLSSFFMICIENCKYFTIFRQRCRDFSRFLENTGKCSLYIGKESSQAEKADCREEIVAETNDNHRYIRFFTYNTEQDEQGKLYIWRTGKCRLEEISLEVHCGFP